MRRFSRWVVEVVGGRVDDVGGWVDGVVGWEGGRGKMHP